MSPSEQIIVKISDKNCTDNLAITYSGVQRFKQPLLVLMAEALWIRHGKRKKKRQKSLATSAPLNLESYSLLCQLLCPCKREENSWCFLMQLVELISLMLLLKLPS